MSSSKHSHIQPVVYKPSSDVYEPSFSPRVTHGKRIVIPVSMGRYQLSDKKIREYDEMLASLFERTASLLREGEIEAVDVISTGELQGINWDAELVKKTEQHFLNTHCELLAQQSNCYTWQEWVDNQGAELYESYYGLVLKNSEKNSEWYDLMVRTARSIQAGTELEQSLEYQRREYAAIMLMQNYHNLIYTGPISLAWSYLYHIFPSRQLPTFTRASFCKKEKAEKQTIAPSDSSHTTKLLLSMIEQTLTSENFPESEKQKLIDSGISLFYAYEPRKKVKLKVHG